MRAATALPATALHLHDAQRCAERLRRRDGASFPGMTDEERVILELVRDLCGAD